MLTFSLQSGSNGNCIYVEAEGVALLFDAGISARQVRQRLAERGRGVEQIQAVIISHDHTDHIRCAGIYQRRLGLPIYMTKAVLQRAAGRLGPLRDVRGFEPGQALRFGPLRVQTIRTAHDAPEGVAFVVEARRRRLGILTDLGHPFTALRQLMDHLDAAYLESNYDPHMLNEGPYPEWLKAWIRGPGGHLSNAESAGLARRGAAARLQWVAVAHLSEQNNLPELAIEAHRRATGRGFAIHWASRYRPSDWLSIM
jgi:phosphoribosyl 1,2-cyclic phosphodiesterase